MWLHIVKNFVASALELHWYYDVFLVCPSLFSWCSHCRDTFLLNIKLIIINKCSIRKNMAILNTFWTQRMCPKCDYEETSGRSFWLVFGLICCCAFSLYKYCINKTELIREDSPFEFGVKIKPEFKSIIAQLVCSAVLNLFFCSRVFRSCQ